MEADAWEASATRLKLALQYLMGAVSKLGVLDREDGDRDTRRCERAMRKAMGALDGSEPPRELGRLGPHHLPGLEMAREAVWALVTELESEVQAIRFDHPGTALEDEKQDQLEGAKMADHAVFRLLDRLEAQAP